jgi:hypothetical protein
MPLAGSAMESRRDNQGEARGPWRVTCVSSAVGLGSACGLTTDGAAYCWGYNGGSSDIGGALGDGTTDNRSTPGSVVGGLTFSQISVGNGHRCGSQPQARLIAGEITSLGSSATGPSTGAPCPSRSLVPLGSADRTQCPARRKIGLIQRRSVSLRLLWFRRIRIARISCGDSSNVYHTPSRRSDARLLCG